MGLGLFLKIKKEDGQKAIKILKEQSLFDRNFLIEKDDAHLFLPIKKDGLVDIKKQMDGLGISYQIIENEGRKKKIVGNLRFILKQRVGKDVPLSSYDIIGDICVVEIKPEYERFEQEIASCLLDIHPNIRMVCAKASPMEGEFRVRKFRVLKVRENKSATTETIHKEHGVRMKLDVAKVYFSPRLSFERGRVAKQVREGENVMVFFAGVGPFALVIAKHHPKAKVVGIELNPYACKYFEENILLNKLENVNAVFGDVREKKNMYRGWANRVLMPLPKGAELFISDALDVLKKEGVLHLYSFQPAENAFLLAREKLEKECAVKGWEAKIINKRIVRPFSPSTIQVVIDAFVKRVD
jgi:tRNA (guanine37-N1)-methyltransferase